MSDHDERPLDETRPHDAGDGAAQTPAPGTYPPPVARPTPAAYPPPAPYPPVSSDPGTPAEPYAQPPAQPYAQPYGQPSAQAYGQQQPYGQGYGQSAAYTTTPQPYAYGPPPLSPEADQVRSHAILWTVLNAVSLVLGFFAFVFNIPSLVGIVLGAVAIGRARTDAASARSLVRWSWILFAAGIALGILWWIGLFLFAASLAAGTPFLLGGF